MSPKKNMIIPISGSRAFAFTADMVLALILVTGLFIFATFPTQPAPQLEERRVTDQLVDDTFVALDHLGYVSTELDINGFSNSSLQNIYGHTRDLLPPTYDFYLELSSYGVDIASCRSSQSFDDCFPDANKEQLAYGTTLPSDAAFIHGKRVFLKQQPASECIAGLSPPTGEWSSFSSREPLSFQSSPDLNIILDVNVTPSSGLTCDQNITVDLFITTGQGSRKAVDMMMVFDRSGSMSYDSLLQTSDATGIAFDNNIAYVADGTGGLRTIDVSTPTSPTLLDTYNTPGTARDVYVNGNYAYVADGTSGLRVVDVANPSNISSAAQLSVGGDVMGVAGNGTDIYVATYSSSGANIVNTGGTGNGSVYVGRSTTQSTAAQSIQPSVAQMSAVSVRVRKQGSPSGDLTVSIRSSISGSDLTSATISSSSVGGSLQYLTVTFPDILPLTAGTTYYIVLSTSSDDSSNYYILDKSTNNSYGSGAVFQNTTAQSGDARFRTFYVDGLIHVDASTPTDPQFVGAVNLDDAYRLFIENTTAFVADGASGLRIFDISTDTPSEIGSYNTPNSARDVYVSGNTAFVSDNTSGLITLDVSSLSSPTLLDSYNTPSNAVATKLIGNTAYVVDGDSIQVLDVTSPSAISFVDSYATPWNYSDLEISGEWGFIAVDSGVPGMAVLNLSDGPKITQAKAAAHTFIDFNGWTPASDQIGLVSYSSAATTDQSLSHDFNAVSNAIDALAANGSTATGTAINAATSELTGSSANPDAIKFEILMSDGLTNTGLNSSTESITAGNAGIIIYAIGFGSDADETELTTIANNSGGKYYAATDENALIEVYALIAQDIQLIASDANLVAGFPDELVIIDDGNGVIADGNIFFDINTLKPQPWKASYTFNIPCTSSLACSSSIISIPSPGTVFEYVDANGDTQHVDWNVFVTQPFSFKDLNIEIISAELLGSNNVDLTVKVESAGNLDTNATTVNFYQNDPSFGTLLHTTSVPALCGGLAPSCVNHSYTFTQNVSAEGELYGVVNPDNIIHECLNNNQDVVFCYYTPETSFYTLEYWAWLHV